MDEKHEVYNSEQPAKPPHQISIPYNKDRVDKLDKCARYLGLTSGYKSGYDRSATIDALCTIFIAFYEHRTAVIDHVPPADGRNAFTEFWWEKWYRER